MSQQPDLSAFPVLRIDQIPLVDSDTLADAQKESKDLIASLLAESAGTIPPMVNYLRKQNDLIATELLNRLAQDRINELLSGATSLLNSNRSKYVLQEDDDHSLSSVSTLTQKSAQSPVEKKTPTSQIPVPAASFQPLPLPSERRKVDPLLITPRTKPVADTSSSAQTETSGDSNVGKLLRSESSPVGIAMSSRSASGRNESGEKRSTSPGSENSKNSRRPLSGDIRPSRRSQEIINNNFGSLFIVAGEGRRRRQLPAKKPMESVEEVKARERLDRRKAAMQRLLERKEERMKMRLAKKESQRAAKREAERSADAGSTRPPRNAADSQRVLQSSAAASGKSAENAVMAAGDSSGSESVSGGDDEVEVAISAEMISAVAQAQVQEAQAEQLANGKALLSSAVKSPARQRQSSSTGKAVSRSRIIFSKGSSSPDVGTGSPSSSGLPRKNIASIATPDKSTTQQTAPAPAKASEGGKPKRVRGAGLVTGQEAASDADNESMSGRPRHRAVPSRPTATTAAAPTPASTTAQETSNGPIKRRSIYHSSTPVKEDSSKGAVQFFAASSVPDVAISQEELEAKSSAALQSLRSMKLKKEQLRRQQTASDETVLVQTVLPEETASREEAWEELVAAQDSARGSCTAVALPNSTALIVPNTDRELARYGDEQNRSVVLHKGEESYQVGFAESSRVVLSNLVSESAPTNPPDGASEEEEQEGGNHFEPTSLQIREYTLQIDAAPVPVSEPVRPSTTPLPASPSRRAAHIPTDAGEDERVPSSPTRRRNTALDFGSLRPADEDVGRSIDLSNETLEVETGPDKFVLPASARKIAGPANSAVAQLLAGHAHSALLYIQDGQYYSSLGPDDLPGLCAWKLASIVDECANWVVNIAKYSRVSAAQCKTPSHPALFTRRASARRSVSLGLLVLLLDVEDIMLGRDRLFSPEHFTTLWKEYIRLFDEKAEDLAVQYGPEILFTETAVCGNCHAICKKLENLLKTLFVPDSSSSEATLHRALHAQEDILPPPSPRDLDARFARHVEERDDARGHPAAPAWPAEGDSLDGDGNTRSCNQSELDDTDFDHNASQDEDDASIVPIYPPSLYNQFLAQQEQEARDDANSAQDSTPADIGATENRLVPIEAGEKDDDKVERRPARSAGSKKAVQLTEFYPNIASIFPAVSCLMGNRAAEDASGAARVLIESMQVQCKIYEEWIEVMSDYSTVFSENRGVAENYYSEENAEAGGDAASSATVYKGGTRSLHFRVKSGRSEVNNIVTDVFNNFLKEWEELPAGLGLGLSWNILWTWSKPRIKMSHLLAWQRVNHYPDSKELTRKDLLKKNIQRYTNMGGKGGAQFDIMPLTFLLPHEYTAFVQAFTTAETNKGQDGAQNFWILKPIGMSRGRGISLVKDLGEIAYSQSSVVQKYIERPLCLQGYKFDLRLYILVTSFKPLEAFIYRDGFARVSTHQYSLNPADTENKFIHLTNSSIQCQNTEGITKDNPLQTTGHEEEDNDTGGSKISLLGANGLWKRLQQFGVDIAALWQSICNLVIKSLVMVDDKMVNQPCCFEMFGYDVLIDADLRPWLLEVNASPSLARGTPLDVRVKNAMIRDIINIIDPAPFDRAAVLRILQRRLGSIAKNRFTVGKNDPDLEQDLRDILGDHTPRKYGETPVHMGNYEMICPNTKEYLQVLKLKKKIIKS